MDQNVNPSMSRDHTKQASDIFWVCDTRHQPYQGTVCKTFITSRVVFYLICGAIYQYKISMVIFPT